jgi:hypothetical protein
MSQFGYTPIQLYRTSTASAAPTSGNLSAGELAINLLDEKLYFKNSSGVVKLLASTTSATGSVSSVTGTGTVNGITLTGTVTSSGNLTLGGALSGVSLTSQVSGTLPIANGGTGTTSTTFANLTTNVTGTLPTANGGTGNVNGTVAKLQTTNFNIQESGGKLYFYYGATAIASMDSSGNMIALANVTAYGTP